MVRKFPCVLCSKSVMVNQKGLKCTKCNKWVHILCCGVSNERYENTLEQFCGWECQKCTMEQLPFYNVAIQNEDTVTTQKQQQKYKNKSFEYGQLNKNGFNCAQLNVVSLLKHFEEIEPILCKNNIHVFALNETRLDDSIQDTEIKISHYNLIRKDRNRQGGGVAIYVHESITYKQVLHDSSKDLEVVILFIELKKCKPLLFCNWYRPPNSKCEVLSTYEDMLTFLEENRSSVVLMGDINLNISHEPLSSECKKYCQLKDIHDLHQLNTMECTRVTSDSSSLLDHMLCNQPENVDSWGVIDIGFSDHSLSFFILEGSEFKQHVHSCKVNHVSEIKRC